MSPGDPPRKDAGGRPGPSRGHDPPRVAQGAGASAQPAGASGGPSRARAAPAAQGGPDDATIAHAVDRSLREATVRVMRGYPYIVHPLTDGVPRTSPDLLIAWAEWAAAQQEVLQGATVLLAPEAMALPLAAALSMKTGIPYLAVRKREYGLPGETVAYCETGYGKSCLYLNGLRGGDRVVVVDDVLSTGGTLDAILATLASMGPPVEVAGALVFVDKGGGAAALAKRHKVPVRAMRAINVRADRVVVQAPTSVTEA